MAETSTSLPGTTLSWRQVLTGLLSGGGMLAVSQVYQSFSDERQEDQVVAVMKIMANQLSACQSALTGQ